MPEAILIEGDGDPDPITLDDLQKQVSPKLTQTTDSGRLEVEPIAVTRLGGTLPFETDTISLDGGGTLTDSSGDQHTQFVYKCIVSKTQFDTIARMRKRDPELKLVSAAYTGPITFDEIKFDRITDANGAITQTGETNEALFEVQLQSKENSEDDDMVFDASNS